MKILITSGYFYRLDPKQWKNQQPYPPLGTLIAAGELRRAGFEVRFFDAGLAPGPEALIPVLDSFHPKVTVIYDDGFNYLTKMCLTTMREAAFKLVQFSKQAGCDVLVCSSDATDHCDQYLAKGADAIVRGEGEVTLLEAVNAMRDGKRYAHLEGISFFEGAHIRSNPTRPVLKGLDGLSAPAWDLVDLEKYRHIWKSRHGYFSMNLSTTRGCPFHCNWCAKPIYGNRYNSRTPLSMAAEIELLLKTYHPDHIWFCDDIFGLKPGWVTAFRDEVKRRQLKFRFKIQCRADLLLQEDNIAALADAGAETVWIGAESGSQKILDAMDKGITVEQIREATRLLRSFGIRVGFFLQFGYPGETKADIERTLSMTLGLMPDEVGVSVSYPLPGTPFYERVKSELSQKQNWTDSDDLALMFRNTYSPGYYKALHRYFHARFRIQRGWNSVKRWVSAPFIPGAGDMKTLAAMISYTPVALFREFQLKRLE